MTHRHLPMRGASAVALALFTVHVATSQVAAGAEETLAHQIDQMFVEAYPDDDGPGAAMLVMKDGEVVYRGARGMANVELGVELSPDQVFRRTQYNTSPRFNARTYAWSYHLFI